MMLRKMKLKNSKQNTKLLFEGNLELVGEKVVEWFKRSRKRLQSSGRKSFGGNNRRTQKR